jgi:hypothetical protein
MQRSRAKALPKLKIVRRIFWIPVWHALSEKSLKIHVRASPVRSPSSSLPALGVKPLLKCGGFNSSRSEFVGSRKERERERLTALLAKVYIHTPKRLERGCLKGCALLRIGPSSLLQLLRRLIVQEKNHSIPKHRTRKHGQFPVMSTLGSVGGLSCRCLDLYFAQ